MTVNIKAINAEQTKTALTKWSQVPFSNRFMFRLVMENKDICKRTLELLLGIEIDELEYAEGEKSIEARLSSKGIRLDVYIKDKAGNIFDLEMQATDADHESLGQRARYYQSIIDADSLRKGVAYAKLPKSVVLFVCKYDPFGKNYVRYTFSNLCHNDTNLELGDLSSKVIINTLGDKTKCNSDIRNFLDYVNTGLAKDEFTKQINNEVELQRSDEKKAVMYMTWEQEQMEAEARGEARGEAKGKAEGKAEGKVETLLELVKEGLLSVKNAATKLDMSEEEFRKKYSIV